MQKLKYFLLLNFCFSFFLLHAQQKVKVSIYLGANYSQIDAANTINKSERSFFQNFGIDSNGDSTITIARVQMLSEIGHEFEVLPGPELGILFDFPLGKKIDIQTGFGLSGLSYKPTDPFISQEVDRSVDTIFTTTPYSTNLTSGSNSFCDTIINNPVIISITKTHSIVFLKIPVNVSYQAIEDVLKVNAGLFISTPLYTSERSARFNLNRTLRTTSDGATYYECESVQGTHINTTGDRFRQFTFGANLGLNYQASKRFSIGVNFSRHLLPIYNETQSISNFLTFSQEPVKPYLTTGSIRLNYSFGQSNKTAL